MISATTMAKGAKQDSENTALSTRITNAGTPFSNATATGVITALDQFVSIATQGYSSVTFNRVGTFSGMLVVEAYANGAWTFLGGPDFMDEIPATATYTIRYSSMFNVDRRNIINCAGWSQVRVRCSNYTSGSVTISFAASINELYNRKAAAGDGQINSIPLESSTNTYSAALTGIVPATSATDIFTISGISGSQHTRILRIEITATQTTAAVRDILLIKRTTANTGGTFTTATGIGHAFFTATESIKGYTANPTALGTGTLLRSSKVLIGPTTAEAGTIVWEFGDTLGQPLILDLNTDSICVNLNGVTYSGGLFDISVEFAEK